MKLKHTQKKSANRSISVGVFTNALIGIARKHGQKLQPQTNNQFTKPKRRHRRRTEKQTA